MPGEVQYPRLRTGEFETRAQSGPARCANTIHWANTYSGRHYPGAGRRGHQHLRGHDPPGHQQGHLAHQASRRIEERSDLISRDASRIGSTSSRTPDWSPCGSSWPPPHQEVGGGLGVFFLAGFGYDTYCAAAEGSSGGLVRRRHRYDAHYGDAVRRSSTHSGWLLVRTV